MNQTFDWNRWWLLVSRHWIENRKRYLLSFLAIPGLMLAWFGFILFIGGDHPLNENIQSVSYLGGLYIVGCFYASMQFNELNERPKGIIFLSLPASHFEKLLCAIVYGVILFYVFYSLIFYAIDIPMVKISNALGYERFRTGHSPEAVFMQDGVFKLFPNRAFIFLEAYFPIQSAFLLGSVYFTRYSFIKTAIALLIIWFFFAPLIGEGFDYLKPAGWQWENLAAWHRLDNLGEVNMIRLPPWIENLFDFLLKYSIPVILWSITYFRLKEKEI